MSAGSLTTVMRAAQGPSLALPQVLRIAVVRSGRIVDERVIKDRGTVSIGASEDATFVTESPRFDLFVRRGAGYVLRVEAGMSGRVGLASGVVTLAASTELPLTDDARGKVVVGETTFLFQLVRPAPAAPRPQLPLSVKAGLTGQIDWSLTIIAAFSFLLHFGVVGAMYSDWTDQVLDDRHTVAGLVDLMQKIPTPPATETPTTDASAEAAPTTATPTATKGTTAKSSSSSSKNHSSSSSSRVDDRQAASLVAQAENMQIGLLVGLNRNSSVEGALNRGDIPPVDLSSRAASADGATASSSDLHLRGGNTSVAARPSTGLPGVAGNTHGTASTDAGETRVVAAPKLEPQIGVLQGGASVTGADRVIAGLRGRFRACYQKGLNNDATMSGKVVITAKIGPNGEVTSADVSSSSGLSGEVTSCIALAVKRAQFEPQATATTLSVPVSFVRQN